MTTNGVAMSLIVATKGRATPVRELFESLEAQEFRDFEVVLVDQNADDRVGSPEAEGWSFPVTHLRTPGESGLSRARNAGIAASRGPVLLFPDDDCWYPPRFLGEAMARMAGHGADVLAGRAADAEGRDINGRFERTVTTITRSTVWSTGIEWVVLFRRDVLAMTSGYDVGIGVGASTPWQACEGQDIMLRAIRAGYHCVYDPALYGHHAPLDVRSQAMLRKGRAYARGHGYVLRRHGYPLHTALTWVARPAVRAILTLLKGDLVVAAYCWYVALGRWEGWRMRVAISPRDRDAAGRGTRRVPAVNG